MKWWVLVLMFVVLWSVPARASIIPTGMNINISGPAVSTLSGSSGTNPAVNGDRISISVCVATTTAVFTTPSGFSADGSTFTGTNGQCAHFSKNASGEPANFNGYTVSWTTAASACIQIRVYHGTQGANTISYDAQATLNTTATTPSIPSPTLAQAGEVLEFDGLAAGFNVNSCNNGPYLFQGSSSWGSCIWGESTTTIPAAPTVTASGNATWTGQTIAFKETVAGAAVYVGSSTVFGGSALSVNIGNSSQAVAGDTNFAVLGINSSSPGITPPADIWMVEASSPNSASFTISSSLAAAGMIAVVCAYSGSALTAPAGFTNICTDSANFFMSCDYKVLVGGDVGATKTYTGGSPNVNYSLWQSSKGASLAIDGASACTSVASANNANAPSITTGTANEFVISEANQGGSSGVTIPIGEVLVASRANNASGWFLQATAGATGTKNFTSAGSNTWEVATIGVKGDGSGSQWTRQATVSNANANPNASTLSVYSHKQTATDPPVSVGWFWQYGATGNQNVQGILTFGNLNGTTPVDAVTTLASNQVHQNGNTLGEPSINPTANDELLLRVGYLPTNGAIQTPAAGLVLAAGLNQPNGALEAVYDDASLNAFQYLANGTVNSTGALGISLGLQSATTPTRTTANQRVDQLGLITLAPFGAPEPPPSCGNCGLGVGAP